MSTNPTQASWPLKKPQQLVYVELGPHNGGMMLGICEVGLTFRAVAPLRADGPIAFTFALDGKSRLQGVGEIAWAEEDGKTGGLKFTDVSAEFRAALRAWLTGESASKTVGREVTPAVALPLDSIEKIKSHIREGNIEEIKAGVVAPPSEEKRIQEKPAAKTLLPPALVETRSTEPPSLLPKLRLPSAPLAPAPAPAAVSVQTSTAPETATSADPELPQPDLVPEAPAFPPLQEPQKEYPPLPGLHQPYAHVPPPGEIVEEPPRLNRAAAAGIISLALAVILVALVLSFRREVGETLIRLGEALSGEDRSAVLLDSKPAPASPSSAPAPTEPRPAAAKTDSSATTVDTNKSTPSPNSAVPESPAAASIQRIEDLPAPPDGGSGQKEFDQARNILKGNHRQRDISVAVDLLWTGVRKGFVPAEVTLADLYARGDGVERSCEQARVLLDAAVRKGSPEGRRRLAQLRQQGCS